MLSDSQFESVVTVMSAVALVFVLAGGCGVELGCGVGYFAQSVENLIASLKQPGGLAAGCAGCVGGGEVVFDAADGGGGLLLVAVGGAEVLG